MEPVLANIDADYDDCSVEFLRHGVLLVFGAPRQLRLLVGQKHGRTIPLADIPALPAFVRYWSNSGHWLRLARDGLVATDPTATLASFDREPLLHSRYLGNPWLLSGGRQFQPRSVHELTWAQAPVADAR
jgi:hypothetical protein